MKYVNIFLFLAFALNSAQTIPDNLTAERLKEMPDAVVDRILDGLREEDSESTTIDGFLSDGEFKTYNGFLTIHQKLGKIERGDDEYYLEIKEGQLNSEFIYFAYVLNAPQAAGVRGGAIGQGAVLEFRKFKDGIALYKKNTYFSNETDNNISKADLTNILEAFLAELDIVAEQDGRVVVKIDGLWKRH